MKKLNSTAPAQNIQEVPTDILGHIFQFLSPEELKKITPVSKHFYLNSNHNLLWFKKLNQHLAKLHPSIQDFLQENGNDISTFRKILEKLNAGNQTELRLKNTLVMEAIKFAIDFSQPKLLEQILENPNCIVKINDAIIPFKYGKPRDKLAPLLYAIFNEKRNCLDILFAKGARLDTVSEVGLTIFHCLAMSCSTETFVEIEQIYKATPNLQNYDAFIDSANQRSYPILYTIFLGKEPTVKKLAMAEFLTSQGWRLLDMDTHTQDTAFDKLLESCMKEDAEQSTNLLQRCIQLFLSENPSLEQVNNAHKDLNSFLKSHPFNQSTKNRFIQRIFYGVNPLPYSLMPNVNLNIKKIIPEQFRRAKKILSDYQKNQLNIHDISLAEAYPDECLNFLVNIKLASTLLNNFLVGYAFYAAGNSETLGLSTFFKIFGSLGLMFLNGSLHNYDYIEEFFRKTTVEEFKNFFHYEDISNIPSISDAAIEIKEDLEDEQAIDIVIGNHSQPFSTPYLRRNTQNNSNNNNNIDPDSDSEETNTNLAVKKTI